MVKNKSKKTKIIVSSIVVCCFSTLIIPYIFTNIKLNGKNIIEINYDSVYKDEGAEAKFIGIPLVVKTIGYIDTHKLGKQYIIYEVRNKIGIIKKKKRTIRVVDSKAPVITLLGDKEMEIKLGEKYIDPGYEMIDNVDGNISKQVKIKNNINNNKIGTYEIIYTGIDSSKNKTTCKRLVKVVKKDFTYKDEYDNIDNTARTWWSGNKKNNTRPNESIAATSDELKKYNAYYIGPDDKTIYLTFDEGSNDTYVKEISEVLNKYNVKATFFFCLHYIKSNPDVIKSLEKNGHSIGNHTANHAFMYKYANKNNFTKFLYEISEVEKIYKEITGKDIDKIYREPGGNWSYRDLQIVKDLGYKTFFWSADYLDFEDDVSKDYALTSYMKRYHNGAIFLIHPKNKGNYEAMEDFIKNMIDLGYKFGLVKNIK